MTHGITALCFSVPPITRVRQSQSPRGVGLRPRSGVGQAREVNSTTDRGWRAVICRKGLRFGVSRNGHSCSTCTEL